MSDHETTSKIRGMVRRVVLKNIKDDGEAQTASVEVADGIWRDNVEISQVYGLSSHAPEDGALAIVLAIGGDEGDMVALPVGNPSKRLGGLGKGEVGIYNEHGDKIVVDAGGNIRATSATTVSAEVGGSKFTLSANSFEVTVGGVTMKLSSAGLEVTGGQVKHNGKNIGDTHVHGGVVPGGANTSVPA